MNITTLAAIAALLVVCGAIWYFAKRGKLSAKDLYSRVEQLQKKDAQWPESFSTSNPGDDRESAALLIDRRGPHMFDPRAGLNVISECGVIAFRADKRASARDALAAARQSMDRVVGYGR